MSAPQETSNESPASTECNANAGLSPLMMWNLPIFQSARRRRSKLLSVLNESKNTRDERIEQSRENNIRNAIPGLKAKVKQNYENLANVPLIWNVYKSAVDDTKEKIRICEDIERVLTGDYSMAVNDLQERQEAYREKIKQLDEVDGKIFDEKSLFQQKHHLNEVELNKIQHRIDLATEARDGICIKYGEAEKILSRNSSEIDSIRQGRNKMKDAICALKSDFVNDEDVINGVIIDVINDVMNTDRNSILEKTEAFHKLNKDREELRLAEQNLEIKLKTGNLRTAKIQNKLKKLTKRIQNAKTNRHENETAESEFNRERTRLVDSINKSTDDTVALQLEMKARQSLYNNVMRIREEVLKKKQSRSELQQKLTQMKEKKWKLDHKIGIMREYVEVMEHEYRKSSKRPRLTDDLKAADYNIDHDQLAFPCF